MQAHINLAENGLFVFENVPPGTEVGIDYHSWHVGPKFRGISNIPPGFHFIFFSSVDKHQQYSPRTGFFIFIKPSDVIVRKYDKESEDFIDENVNVEECLQNIEETARYLAPYPLKECKIWSSLVNYVLSEQIDKIQPRSGKITCLTEVIMKTKSRRKGNLELVDSRLPHKADPDSILAFTNIPSDFPENATPQEKSKYCMDSSHFLEELIENVGGDENAIFGELQIAFVCFLIGQVYDAFEHWKDLVTLLTNCRECLATRATFYLKVLDILALQVGEIPNDYFVDISAQNSFLLQAFQSFFHNFSDPVDVPMELVRKASILRQQLSTQFEWNFNEENEEDMPVIVEI